MTPNTIKLGKLTRSFTLDRASVNKDERTVQLAFSSESGVERWFGKEILDHQPASVRLSRLKNGGALLVDHRSTDHVGVVEKVELGNDRVGRAVVRFGKGARAEEIFNDVLDGVRRHVSVGYLVHRFVLEEEDEAGSTYRATDWEPLEISIVAVPADPSVGVGRAESGEEREVPITPKGGTRSMEPKPDATAEAVAAARTAAANEARQAEQARVREITAIGRQFDAFGGVALATEAVNSGETIDAFRTRVVTMLAEKKPVPKADLGLTSREVKAYSFLRAIRSQAFPQERKFYDEAAFEREVSDAASKACKRTPQGLMIPPDVLRAPLLGLEGSGMDEVVSRLLARMLTRDLVKGTPTAGGHTVATDLLAASFIDLLRNRMVLQRLGITTLNGLVGDIAIPRQTGGATAYWVAESGAPTESQQAFDQVTMSPKTVGAFTDYSRKLLLQTSIDIEAFVRGDLTKVIGLELDRVGLYGSGAANQPRGINATAGINSKNFAGSLPTWAEIVALETEVATDNADIGTLKYATNAIGRGGLKTTEKAATTGQFIWEQGNTVNGYPCEVSNQIVTASGTDPDFWFGNWSDLLLGIWSGLDLMVDPYTGSTSGTVRIVALQDVDYAVRHPESFCKGANNP